jgi:type I restriction enzyme M protein
LTEDLEFSLGLIVPKEKIAANGEYNLSGERYRDNIATSSKYPWTDLGSILLRKPQYGSGASKVDYDGVVRYIRITDLTDNGDLKESGLVSPSIIEEDCFLEYEDLLIARSGSVGRTYLHQKTSGKFQYAGYLIRFRIDPVKALPAFVFQITQSPHWNNWIVQQSKTGTISNINAQEYSSFRLPLPPIAIQQEIVTEIEGYQKVINGARAVIDNYRPHIAIDPDWEIINLGEICSFKNGLNFTKAESGYTVKIIGVSNFQTNLYAPLDDLDTIHLDSPLAEDYLVKGDDILFVRSNGNADLVGRSMIIPPPQEPTTFSGFTIRGRIEDDRALPVFYAHFLSTGQKFNRVKEGLKIEMKVKDEVTQEIKANAKNALR